MFKNNLYIKWKLRLQDVFIYALVLLVTMFHDVAEKMFSLSFFFFFTKINHRTLNAHFKFCGSIPTTLVTKLYILEAFN